MDRSTDGPDNDVRLTAPDELCGDVQRLTRSTLVKISASDSPAALALHRIASGRHT